MTEVDMDATNMIKDTDEMDTVSNPVFLPQLHCDLAHGHAPILKRVGFEHQVMMFRRTKREILNNKLHKLAHC